MLIGRLIKTQRTDSELSGDVRAALIDSLFAPIVSLIVGAFACSVVGGAVALRANDNFNIITISAAIFAVGMLRVVSALLYKRSKEAEDSSITKRWERIYELGAWGFAGLLGTLCWFTIHQVHDATLQMVVTTTAAGYAAAISGRNAGRPLIAVGQLTLISLPMAAALLADSDWLHKTLGIVVLLFIYGMIDITLGIRDVIIQALTITRKEAALATRFEEQAKRFDIALNNMSHGLCMLDQNDRLQVWNERFLELLHLHHSIIYVGMSLPRLVRHILRANNHNGMRAKQMFRRLVYSFQPNQFDQIEISPYDDCILSLSRRIMSDGGSVVILEDVSERKRVQARLEHLARYDHLTGLANRTQFRERFNEMIYEAGWRNNQIAVHLMDLDRFKSINDTLGHPIGDKLLKAVATRLLPITSHNDIITRIGGDEFVVLQQVTTPHRDAQSLAQQFIKAIEEPFDIDGHRIDIGVSIGIAIAPTDGTDADVLLKKSDMALYAAKNDGGSGHRFFSTEMEEAIQCRRSLELDLREALTENQFQIYYQPLVDLHNGQIITFEALLRWIHPTGGEISPSIFIPVAEETGQIIALGEWVLQQACAAAATWPHNIKVAVNLSPIQFRARNLPLQVASALAKSGLSARRLELEVTERLLLEDNEGTLATIEEINNLGVGFSLDDFGTGYSSLHYLHKFPFNKIKIDQSFINERRDSRFIINAIANLGSSLNKAVVAEGIETKEQMDMVKAQGCNEGQGYFFCRPMPKEAVHNWLEKEAKADILVA